MQRVLHTSSIECQTTPLYFLTWQRHIVTTRTLEWLECLMSTNMTLSPPIKCRCSLGIVSAALVQKLCGDWRGWEQLQLMINRVQLLPNIWWYVVIGVVMFVLYHWITEGDSWWSREAPKSLWCQSNCCCCSFSLGRVLTSTIHAYTSQIGFVGSCKLDRNYMWFCWFSWKAKIPLKGYYGPPIISYSELGSKPSWMIAREWLQSGIAIHCIDWVATFFVCCRPQEGGEAFGISSSIQLLSTLVTTVWAVENWNGVPENTMW